MRAFLSAVFALLFNGVNKKCYMFSKSVAVQFDCRWDIGRRVIFQNKLCFFFFFFYAGHFFFKVVQILKHLQHEY